jgi:hypothetical protein
MLFDIKLKFLARILNDEQPVVNPKRAFAVQRKGTAASMLCCCGDMNQRLASKSELPLSLPRLLTAATCSYLLRAYFVIIGCARVGLSFDSCCVNNGHFCLLRG